MKILVVDDHPMVRKGIASALTEEKEIDEVLEGSGVDEAIKIINRNNPEIALIDLYLGKEDGMEIVKKVKESNAATKFIIITSSSKREDVTRAQETGVDGYILKEAFIEDIVYALSVVRRGKKFFDAGLFQSIACKKHEDSLFELTPRESEVLCELGKGLSNAQIADKLFISEHTVKKHISCILAKLKLNHRTEAALYVNNKKAD